MEPGRVADVQTGGPDGKARRPARVRAPTGRLGRIALYGSSRSVVEGLLGLRGIVLAGMLGPQLFGIWALFRLTLTYCGFLAMGLSRGLELEVARARGEGQAEIRRAWGRAAAGFTLAVFGAVALVLAAAAGFADEPWLRQLLCALAATVLLERMYFHGKTYLRASGSLRQYAIIELLQAAAQALFTLGLGALFGLEGAFAGFALANLVALVILARRAPFRPAFDRERLRAMLSVGVPLSLTLLLSALLATADRLILGAAVGLEALGQYAFAVSVAALGMSAALIVRTVVVPDVYARLGSETAAEVTRAHMEDTIRPFVLFLSPLVGLGILVLGPVVAVAVPQYAASLPAACVFIFIGVAQGAVSLAVVGVIAARQQRILPVFSAIALLLNAGLAFGALELGLGLQGLATGALIGRLAYALGAVSLAAQAADRAAVRTALSLLWPIPWCALVVIAIGLWRLPDDAATLAQALGLYVIGTAPVSLTLMRKVLAFRRSRPGHAGKVGVGRSPEVCARRDGLPAGPGGGEPGR
jgi:O-antigen/teichoic acid export membrane protein